METRQTKQKGSKCPICGHSFLLDVDEGARLIHTSPAGMFQAVHDRENHPDYLAWKRSKGRLSIFLGIALGLSVDVLIAYILFSLGVQLPRGRAGAWPFLIALFTVMPIPLLLSNKWGIRKFRREWEAKWGIPPPTSILNYVHRSE